MAQNQNRTDLLQWLNEVSFACIDIALYLDTHPDDCDALEYFQHCKKEREKALALYSTAYGPLTLDCVNDAHHWNWVTTPWPWEGGSCPCGTMKNV